MDFYKYFTLFGKTYHFTIKSEDSNERVYTEITQLLLKNRKLLATKMIKNKFEISLSDAKKIIDNIVEVDINYKRNLFEYKFHIKGRDKIKSYLKEILSEYNRKH